MSLIPNRQNQQSASKQKSSSDPSHRAQHHSCARRLVYSIILILCCSALYADHPASTAQGLDLPIRGFDLSHHQGRINWSAISPQQYQFVYLKATEGADYTDPRFQTYWLAARERGLYVGAYHFFRFCSSSAEQQAQHFIATVPKKNDALPPVIDVEYDTICMAQLTQQQVLKKMQIMQNLLQQHYEKQPIFYSTVKFYKMYLQQHFAHSPIWLQDFSHNVPSDAQIVFWQYSRQGNISAIQGKVDLNVFLGNSIRWQHFLQHHSVELQHHSAEMPSAKNITPSTVRQ